jgi:hypothetical protein
VNPENDVTEWRLHGRNRVGRAVRRFRPRLVVGPKPHPWTEPKQVLTTATAALTPEGTLLLIAHDLANLAEGVGGPQDPAVLQTPGQVAAALPRLRIQKAERIRRPVETDGTTRHAIDTLVRASAPAATTATPMPRR